MWVVADSSLHFFFVAAEVGADGQVTGVFGERQPATRGEGKRLPVSTSTSCRGTGHHTFTCGKPVTPNQQVDTFQREDKIIRIREKDAYDV